jgi:hypothetical protein
MEKRPFSLYSVLALLLLDPSTYIVISRKPLDLNHSWLARLIEIIILVLCILWCAEDDVCCLLTL